MKFWTKIANTQRHYPIPINLYFLAKSSIGLPVFVNYLLTGVFEPNNFIEIEFYNMRFIYEGFNIDTSLIRYIRMVIQWRLFHDRAHNFTWLSLKGKKKSKTEFKWCKLKFVS